MVLVSKYLVPKGYCGITLYPFIFLNKKELKTDNRLLNHENIHLRQQLELLIVPFYVWYILEFLIRYFQYKDWNLAYRNIAFEREAYAKEMEGCYLKNRTFWSFLRYLRNS